MMDLKETILKFADDMQENMVACRRDLHAHPEPGWTESARRPRSPRRSQSSATRSRRGLIPFARRP